MAAVGEKTTAVVILSAGFNPTHALVGENVLLSVNAVVVEAVSSYTEVGCGEFGAGEV